MTSICFATNNKNKLAEIQSQIGSEYTILSLEEIGCFEELPETKETIEENSEQKAAYVFEKYQVNCFADDTGLEVEVLHGAPGVYSARYAGPACSSEDNMVKLLSEMNGETNRAASFKTCITLFLNGRKHVFIGSIKGTITREKHGEKGFGYDPLFIPDGYDRSFAQMSMEEKNAISHRGIAVAKLVKLLRTI